ncbi:MAG: hypothetical protein U1D67_09195 [Dehalococcoidia bacterium]|nr:hypothetical protein [Dehalococcoidia bacterium]MDZ4247279.1 hypothetical protein [Dehalococcoidia bacterium]
MKPIFAFVCGMFVSASLVLIFTPGAKMEVNFPYWPFAVIIALGFGVLWSRAKEKPRI